MNRIHRHMCLRYKKKKTSDLNIPPISQSKQVKECKETEQPTKSHGLPRDTHDVFSIGTNGNHFTVSYLDYLPNGVEEQIDNQSVIQRALLPWHDDGKTT